MHDGIRGCRDGRTVFAARTQCGTGGNTGGGHAAEGSGQFAVFGQRGDVAGDGSSVNEGGCAFACRRVAVRIDFGIAVCGGAVRDIHETAVMRGGSGINEGGGLGSSAVCSRIDEIVVRLSVCGGGLDDRGMGGGSGIGAVLRQHGFDDDFAACQAGTGEDLRQRCGIDAFGGERRVELLLHGADGGAVLRQVLLLPLPLQGGGQCRLRVGVAVFQAAPQQGQQVFVAFRRQGFGGSFRRFGGSTVKHGGDGRGVAVVAQGGGELCGDGGTGGRIVQGVRFLPPATDTGGKGV